MSSKKFYTIMIVPHAAAKFRRVEISRNFLIGSGVFLGLIFKRPVYVAVIWTVIVFFFYTPLGYMTDRAVYNRRMRAKAKKQER